MTAIKDNSAYGIFRVGDGLVGIAIENLAEVCSVSTVSKVMTKAGPVLGAFDLRGQAVPIIDSELLVGCGVREEPVHKAAIIRHNDRITAIAFDEIITLHHPHPSASASEPQCGSQSACGDISDGKVFSRSFVLEGAVVNCLDANAFLANTGVLTAPISKEPKLQRGKAFQRKHLIFTVGGATFGVDSEHVWATIPRKALDTRGVRVDGGSLLGFIEHIRWKVPVIDTNKVFGVGHVSSPSETEVVVLRFPDNKLLGLHVDSTERLIAFKAEEIQQTNSMIGHLGLLKKVVITQDKRQAFLIDYDACVAQPDLKSLSGFSSEAARDGRDAHSDRESAKSIAEDQGRYLIFEAGHKRAVLAEHVLRIMKVPQAIIPASSMPPGVHGFVPVGKYSVPVIDLADDRADTTAEFILLVSNDREQVGFLANRICSIQKSEARIVDGGHECENADLVQIREDGNTVLVPVSDLSKIATALKFEVEP